MVSTEAGPLTLQHVCKKIDPKSMLWLRALPGIFLMVVAIVLIAGLIAVPPLLVGIFFSKWLVLITVLVWVCLLVVITGLLLEGQDDSKSLCKRDFPSDAVSLKKPKSKGVLSAYSDSIVYQVDSQLVHFPFALITESSSTRKGVNIYLDLDGARWGQRFLFEKGADVKSWEQYLSRNSLGSVEYLTGWRYVGAIIIPSLALSAVFQLGIIVESFLRI